MQIVPVSRRFRQNVLQFVFFFSRSAIKQWSRILIPKNVQTHSKWPRKFPTSFYDNVKKCEIERGFVRLPKMKVSIPNTADTHVYDCNSKCRWKIPPSFSRDSWKFPSSFTDHAKSKTIHAVLPQSLNDDEKFCHQCYTNAKNVNILSKIISQTGCKWLPW